jgi:TetR/AcrR family transcriptional repressor of nem operon
MNSKEKIINTATQLFWHKGYKNTSINDILEQVKISKGSFFHHFKDKKTLFLIVIDEFYTQELIALFNKHFHNTENPKQQILDFCTDINISYQKYNFQGGCLLGNMALELSDIDEIFRQKLNEVFNNWQQELIIVLSKIINKKSSEEVANYIIWGLEGLTLTGKVHKNQDKNQKEFEMFINILKTLLPDV